jgi:glycosyltransferase involved in cell wall biosynthesis
VKIAVVVQRYGEAINGGAELHARYIAEHLAPHAQVEVLTTCATDYVTWANTLAPGVESVNGVPVRRFRVRHERNPERFGRQSIHVFEEPHSLADELAWLDVEGPASPALIRYIRGHAADFDYWIFFSYRYYHAFHGARAARGRAILVPTAERDPAVGLSLFGPVFRGVRALMYNSPEERAMIQAVAGNETVPSIVVGVGSNVPASVQPGRFRQQFHVRGPFAVYVGRIDENKGCKELFAHFQQYLAQRGSLSLVLIGNSLLDIPSHERITHLGFLNDADKFDAIAAAELLVMPSYFESLSMVALEAWALGRPVLANAKCDVLKGQCIRSNAGLYYDDAAEFGEALRAIESTRWLSASLGRNGRQFFREHYDWPVIERKYLDMLARLSNEPAVRQIEPLPGWLERRRRDCRPANDVLAAVPSGAVAGGVPRFVSSTVIDRPREQAVSAAPPRLRQDDRRRHSSQRGGRAHRSPRSGRAR